MRKSEATHQLEILNRLTKKLQALSLQIATAESCTGGLIAARLTHFPGSSSWFERAFITYSNDSKEEMLGIDHRLIHAHGAVSAEVAKAMASGALKHSKANVALSVTGIAGPGGGSPKKPVGTVWFAWVMKNFPARTLLRHFEGSREKIRFLACSQALEGTLYLLEGLAQTNQWPDFPTHNQGA